ncbi:MAG: NUDIX hydrolase [Actinomycetota bacterium]
MTGFRRRGESVVHQGYVWHVAVAEFEGPTGEPFTRDIVRSPGAVGIVPVLFDAEGNPFVVLVSQYRPPYERNVIEIPAGMRDIAGESPEAVAHRELAEEVGLAAETMQLLTEIYPSPGMTDSVTTIFIATDCSEVADDRQGPEEEYMELMRMPLADAVAMVVSGEIADAKSVAGLLLAERALHAGDGDQRTVRAP